MTRTARNTGAPGIGPRGLPAPLLIALVVTAAAPAPAARAAEPPPARVGDRLWVWAHDAGVYNGAWGLPGRSRILPAEGARSLGVGNVIMIRYQGKPAPPFDEYARPFRSLRRVMWSAAGAGGATSAEERRQVLALARQMPNLTGLFLDDFFHVGEGSEPHWLARNDAAFPVTLTLAWPAGVAADRVRLVQSRWPSGDYRTADFEVEVSADGRAFRKAGRGQLPNRPGAAGEVRLPPGPVRALRVTVLGTHDTDRARSCGLGGLSLFDGDKEVSPAGARAAASSEYPGHPARNLLGPAGGAAVPAPAALTVAKLRALRQELQLPDRRLDLGVTLYTHQLHAPIRAHLEQCDLVSLWTWRAADLRRLEENFARFEKVVPGQRRLLGLYLWDFGTHRPMPLDLLRHQCDLGLKWLEEGRVEGLILLGTNLADLDLEAVAWARQWVNTVSARPLPARR